MIEWKDVKIQVYINDIIWMDIEPNKLKEGDIIKIYDKDDSGNYIKRVDKWGRSLWCVNYIEIEDGVSNIGVARNFAFRH